MGFVIDTVVSRYSRAVDLPGYVITALAYCANDDGIGFFDRDAFLKIVKISPEGFDQALKDLEESGEILMGKMQYFEGGKHRPVYYITLGQEQSVIQSTLQHKLDYPRKTAIKRAEEIFSKLMETHYVVRT